MNLGFKEHFIPEIISGKKKHTIRKDAYNRWGAGKLIHFCTGLRTKNYKLHLTKPCISVQEFEIKWRNDAIPEIFIDKMQITSHQVEQLAINDGFKSIDDFLVWDSWNEKNFKGKIIHWTDLKYK